MHLVRVRVGVRARAMVRATRLRVRVRARIRVRVRVRVRARVRVRQPSGSPSDAGSGGCEPEGGEPAGLVLGGCLGLELELELDSLLAHLLMQLVQRESRQQAAEGPRVRPLLGDARLPIGTRVMLVSSRVMVMIMVSARVVVGACRSSSARAASALHSASDVPAELEGALVVGRTARMTCMALPG